MKEVLMKCGHSASGISDGSPICAICAPHENAFTVVDQPDLKGRKARCTECCFEMNSHFNLPMFEYRPKLEKDRFYCGCKGWD